MIEYSMQDRKVVAQLEGRAVGQISVRHIDFHWGEGVYVPLAGVAGVGTDKTVRRQGIATRMMQEVIQFALREGYACSAVSTGSANTARRLYSRSGNVYLFSMHSFVRKLQKVKKQRQPRAVTLRPYLDQDAAAVLEVIRETERPFFGAARKELDEWRALRSRPDQPKRVAFVAERDGKIVGFADRFVQWERHFAGEVFVLESEDRFRIGEALLRAVEAGVKDAGETELRFWATECEDFPVRMLRNLGYQVETSRVYQLNILDLQKLLDQLRPLFELRTKRLPRDAIPQRLTLTYDDQSGSIDLGGGQPSIELTASRSVITRVLCGINSAWDAYLRGELRVHPEANQEIRTVLEALLPRVPYQHPVNDWW